jgi:hypothetical protein
MSEHEPIKRPERPTGKIVVPASHHEAAPPPDGEPPVNAGDLASASRSCLAIIVILIVLVLFACVAITIRGAMG